MRERESLQHKATISGSFGVLFFEDCLRWEIPTEH